ncbi:hypothetical protein ACFL3Q_08330 [Planctomycetota bacterium]
MSPNKTKSIITVVDWRKIKVGKLYKGMIKTAVINNKRLRVMIENLDNTQLGRLHDISLPLPVRPGSRTGRFLTAAGQDANTVGKQIVLDDVVGAVIGIRFSTANGSDQNSDFERIKSPQANNADVSASEFRDKVPAPNRMDSES